MACGVFEYSVRPYKWERGTQVISRIPQFKVNGESARGTPPQRDASGGSARSPGPTEYGGRELAGAMGVDVSLSARTGFTGEAEIFLVFSRGGLLCGKYGPLSGTPRMLAARPWSRVIRARRRGGGVAAGVLFLGPRVEPADIDRAHQSSGGLRLHLPTPVSG